MLVYQLKSHFGGMNAVLPDAPLDETDRRILHQLQTDSDRSVATVGESVNLSSNACWRRIKRLEDEGYIKRRVALLDAKKLGAGVTVFVTVRAAEHSNEWLEGFANAVRRIPEVVEFYRMSGEIDYLLKVLVGGIEEYDEVYKRLIRSARLTDVSSAFAMEELKSTTAIPLRP
jgi:Lrp/AsnC family transcriptional regulator